MEPDNNKLEKIIKNLNSPNLNDLIKKRDFWNNNQDKICYQKLLNEVRIWICYKNKKPANQINLKDICLMSTELSMGQCQIGPSYLILVKNKSYVIGFLIPKINHLILY